MKTWRTIACVIVILLLASGCGEKPLTRESLKALQTESLPTFTEPAVRTVDLKSGTRLFLLENHELPIINLTAIVKAGSIYESANELGLATLTAMMLGDGGAPGMTPDAVDAMIDDTAARIEFSSGREMIEGSLESLSSEFDETLRLFMGLLLRSPFDDARLELNQLQFIDEIKRAEDDPEAVAARDFRKLVYGPTSPWARTPTERDVKRLGRDDIVHYGKHYLRPNNLLIAAAGDFDADKLIATLEKLTAGFADEKVAFPAVAPVKKEFEAKIERVTRDLNQAFIYIGQLGIKRHNPDKYALQVMNTVLGGASFKSRLMEDIRSNRGLAYSVWSYFGWGTDYGIFQVYAATKATNEKKVIKLIGQQIAEMAETGQVSEMEFTFAKDVVLNGLIFEFDNAFKIASSQAQYYFYGYPPNYWHIYRDSIAKVTRQDIKRVAHEYLHPDGLKVLIVGPK